MGKTKIIDLPKAVRKNIDSIAAGYSPKRIVVFGSFARGDQHQGSDLDLIVIKDTMEKFPDRIEHVLRYSSGGISIEPLVYTEKELNRMIAEGNNFLKNALEEGIIVYEQ